MIIIKSVVDEPLFRSVFKKMAALGFDLIFSDDSLDADRMVGLRELVREGHHELQVKFTAMDFGSYKAYRCSWRCFARQIFKLLLTRL